LGDQLRGKGLALKQQIEGAMSDESGIHAFGTRPKSKARLRLSTVLAQDHFDSDF
jgi:hypothetical protein